MIQRQARGREADLVCQAHKRGLISCLRAFLLARDGEAHPLGHVVCHPGLFTPHLGLRRPPDPLPQFKLALPAQLCGELAEPAAPIGQGLPQLHGGHGELGDGRGLGYAAELSEGDPARVASGTVGVDGRPTAGARSTGRHNCLLAGRRRACLLGYPASRRAAFQFRAEGFEPSAFFSPLTGGLTWPPSGPPPWGVYASVRFGSGVFVRRFSCGAAIAKNVFWSANDRTIFIIMTKIKRFA